MHLFIDDLELALEKKGSEKLFIATEKEHASTDSVLYIYLQNEFQLVADNQRLTYSYVGKEPSSDLQAIWCYLEVENFAFPKSLTIRNHVLLDLFADQKNIVAVKIPRKKGGYFMMEKNNNEETLELQ